MLLCLLEDSGYVNQNHDVTKTDTENILPEQNGMSGRELETNRFDVDLDELFSCVIENEVYLTLHEAGEKQKQILETLWHYAQKHLIVL